MNMRYELLLVLFGLLWTVMISRGNEILKNDYIRLEINHEGGRIESFQMKSEKIELTDRVGLLEDNFHHVSEGRFFLSHLPYKCQRQGDYVTLQAHHRGGGIDFLELSKRIELKPDEAMVHVKYGFHNLPAAMADMEYGFWSRNFMCPASKGKTVFFPCLNGIESVDVTDAGVQFAYYRYPSRGWMGFVREDGYGLAITMDSSLLKQFYGWYGKTESTFEFYFEKFRLPNDGKLYTGLELIPFNGLRRISGAGGGLVGELDAKRVKDTNSCFDLGMTLYSARKQNIKIVFTSRRLRDGLPSKIYEKNISFTSAGEKKRISFRHNYKTTMALFDLEAKAYDANGKILSMFNEPVSIDAGKIGYRMVSTVKGGKGQEAAINLRKFDKSLVTPHIRWAKPLAGGRIRLLGLTPYPAFRELIELSQRLDVDLKSSFFVAHGRPSNSTGDYFGLLTEADILDNVDVLLQEKSDVILLAGINLDQLSAAQREEIVRKVNAGCGLVLLDCMGKSPELWDISPFRPVEKRSWSRLQPRKAHEGFLSTAIPWKLFPASICTSYRAEGDVPSLVGEYPFLAIRRQGKGRVIASALSTFGGEGRMTGGMTPDLPYPMPDAPYGEYYELYQLLIAKAVAMAAGRDAGVKFSRIHADLERDEYVLRVELDDMREADGELVLEAFTLNREGKRLSQARLDGIRTKRLTLRIPARPWRGQQMIGVILRNRQGKTLDFGAIDGVCSPRVELGKLTSDKKRYQEGEEAVFKTSIKGDVKEVLLRWHLTDGFGRVVAKGNVSVKPGFVQIPVKIESSLLSRNFTLHLELEDQKVSVDRRQLMVACSPRKDKLIWDDYEVGLWITPFTFGATRQYFHSYLASAFRRFGVTTIMGNSRLVDYEFATSNNFHPSIYQRGGTRPASVDSRYWKTGDKRFLERTPCLSSPDFREEKRQGLYELGKKYVDDHVRFYWLGDELSLTGYWSSAIDFCYSADCLRGFATWLKRRYGTLEVANRQWGSHYGSFSEFMPETLTEARRHHDGNYSAWSDHLAYMDRVLCDYLHEVIGNGLLLGDHSALASISGPQGPSAYGGNAWHIQSREYGALLSYPYGGLNDLLRSFNPELVNLPWILGYANYEETVCYELWKSLMVRARGAMAFSAVSMVRPDYTLPRSAQAAAKYLPEIQQGIGKLVLTALKNPPRADVAIVYSQASIRAAYIGGRAKLHDDLRYKYLTLCRNFGIPFRFISEEDIADGLLHKLSPRLLIFPDCEALSTKVLNETERYVREGGVVLVEGKWGEMDSSCKLYPKVRFAYSGKRLIKRNGTRADYWELWNKPARRRTAQERMILEQERSLFEQALEGSGIVPICNLYRVSDGSRFLDGELEVFLDNDSNYYLMAISKEKRGVAVKAKFKCAGDIVDIRQSGLELSAGNPKFWAVLAQRETEPISLRCSGKGRHYQLHIDGRYKRDTVFRLEVIDQEGKSLVCQGANIYASGGRVSYPLTFALSDCMGKYQIRIRDVVTGRRTYDYISIKN